MAPDGELSELVQHALIQLRTNRHRSIRILNAFRKSCAIIISVTQRQTHT